MAIETELKLRIAPEHLDRLKRHPLLKTLATTRATTRKLHSIYYDTPELDLHQRAMALRLRRVGKQWLQTLKGGGEVQAGLHQRNEWEAPVAAEALDFEALKASGARLPQGVRKKLQPVFVTDFSRTSRMLTFEGAEIEFSLDTGEIRAGQATCPISELELELKSGEPLQLFRLALTLIGIVPLELEPASKAEYGYILYTAAKPAVRKASFPTLEKSRSIASALQSMIVACLQHVQANVPGAVHGLDEEYLHQVRVALRRLRVVLAMAETFRADAELTALHEQVAQLCTESGRSREWDVLVTQTLAPIYAHLPEHAGLKEVLRASEKMREHYHDQVQEKLQSRDYQRLLLRFGAWMNSDYWREPDGEDLNLTRFAVQILHKRSKQVSKRGKNLAAADASQLHLLRISCKKLRYAAEMFASLFAAAKTKRYVAALSGLQDIMGMMNDIAIARRLLDEMESQERHETLALIHGWMGHDYMERVVELGKAWKKFSEQKAFWN